METTSTKSCKSIDVDDIYIVILTLFRMALFDAAHGWEGEGGGGGGCKKAPLSKICQIYSTLMKLSTVMTYLKKIQRIHDSRNKPFEFC